MVVVTDETCKYVQMLLGDEVCGWFVPVPTNFHILSEPSILAKMLWQFAVSVKFWFAASKIALDV